MTEHRSEFSSLPVEVHRQIDQFCLTYEQALRSGKRPDIARTIRKQKPVVQAALLAELLAVELEWRLGQGEQPAAADYVGRLPEHAATIERVWSALVEKLGRKNELEVETVSFAGAAGDTSRRTDICPECGTTVEPGAASLANGRRCPECGTKLPGVPAVRVGQPKGTRLGPYEMLEQIGAGAFGTVWKARDTRLDRLVAVKVPRRSQLDHEELEKFLREARAAAQLRHPHIVQVHDVGEIGGVPYIVSDLINGGSLAEWLQKRRLTIDHAIKLAIPIGEALHHAHESGVIHRDLKPANILLDGARRPHLTDFGLARRETADATITVDGQVLGTPAYMSPEQAAGTSHLADRRTDVYSFGVLLFELLTGELPFRGSMRMLLQQVLEQEAPSPRRLNSEVPRDLETITLKCLEKMPASRYGTCQDIVDELSRFQRQEPILARPVGPIQRTWRWCRRKPVVSGLLAVVLMTIAIATLVSLRYAKSAMESAHLAEQRRATAVEQENLAKQETARAEEEKARAGREAARAEQQKQLAEANAAKAKEEGNRAVVRLETIERSDYNSELTAFTAELRRNDLSQFARLLDTTVYPESRREFSWRYHALVTSADLEDLVRIPAPDRPPHHEDNNMFRAIAMSPQGDVLAIGTQAHDIVIYDWPRRVPVRVLKRHHARFLIVAFSANGRQLAAGDEAGEVTLWDVHSGAVLASDKFANGIRSLAFSPDGRSLAVGRQSGGDVVLLRLENGEFARISLKSPVRGPIQALRWMDDGKWLAIGVRNLGGAVCAIEIASGESKFTLRGESRASHLFDVVASPDNRLLSSCDKDQTYIWDVATASLLRKLPVRAHRLEFSPDGRYLALVAWEDVRLFDTESWQLVQEFHMRASTYPLVWFSPNGKSVVTGVSTGYICKWRTHPDASPTRTLAEGDDPQYVHSSLADGQLLTVSKSTPRTLLVRDQRTGDVLAAMPPIGDVPKRSEPPIPSKVALSTRFGLVTAITDWGEITCLDATTWHRRWKRRFVYPPEEKYSQLYSCLIVEIQGRPVVMLVLTPTAIKGVAGTTSLILLLNPDNGEVIRRLDDDHRDVYGLSYAPRRGVLVGRNGTGLSRVWQLPDFEEIASIDCSPATGVKPLLEFSPDESVLIATGDRGALYRVDALTWQRDASDVSSMLTAEQAIFTPDGSTLLVIRQGQVTMYDPVTLEARGAVKLDDEDHTDRVVFGSTGELILSLRDENGWLSWPPMTTQIHLPIEEVLGESALLSGKP